MSDNKIPVLPWTGERYLPEIGGAIELEHLHRYLIAKKLVTGKKVLDIACGEGYGSNKLSFFANYVIGVDISEDAINHARSKYKNHNLEFRVGSAAEIPVESNSIEVVVSFETIEHHDQHEKMMHEIKRVLKSGGLLIMSSPNKHYYSVVPNYSNPYHVKELFTDEFERLLKAFFDDVRIMGQRVAYGSLLISQKKIDSPFSCLTEKSEEGGLSRPLYDFAIASDSPLPELHNSLFEIAIDGVDGAVYLTNSISHLAQVVEERNTQITNLKQALSERDAQIVDFNRTLSEGVTQITSLNQALSQRDAEIVAYHNAALEREDLIRQLYQSHSWRFTKPFRLASRIIRLGLKLNPSKLQFIYQLAKPHLITIIRNPGEVWAKLHFLLSAWRSAGYKGIIQRLIISDALRHIPDSPCPDNSVLEFMRQLAAPHNGLSHRALKSDKTVAIIIPVYRGANETKRCIESVIHSTNLNSYEIIIINDCSPEADIDELLALYEGKYPHVHLLRNETNLGFVQTVNRGMRLAGDADVVLLNSDTEVANDWLDRLIYQAYADEAIGTVTPFSNNATICNYPDLDGWSSLPKGENVNSIDVACSSANAGISVDIPTAVGFCMYIKRACLNDVGMFDDEAFGKGYGEENDFCLRAASKGWRHVLATDIFVFHEGEISFSEFASIKKNEAMKIIRARYPNYENTITAHVIENPAYCYRIAATASRYRLDSRQVILFVTHVYGGGTEKHVQELARELSANDVRILILRPLIKGGNGCDVTLEAYDEKDKLKINLSSYDTELLAGVLNAFGVRKIHIHHTLGFSFYVEELVSLTHVPYDITIHDYYSICPRINLITPGKGYCGSPTVDECNACLAMEPIIRADIEITWWRAKFSSLLNGAENVYCPSNDTSRRISEYFPGAKVKVVPHEIIQTPSKYIAAKKKETRRFAILGVLAEHKGLSLIEEVLAVIEKDNLPIEIVLIGYSERALPNYKFFAQTGPYVEAELPALIEKNDPDAFLFPAQWPETYSYTLSAAIQSGRPIVVSNIGALPERVKEISNSFVYPYDITSYELVQYLLSLQLTSVENKNK